jgi:hypothetical protein
MRLPDGSIVPSYQKLYTAEVREQGAADLTNYNYALRLGYVAAVYLPNSETNEVSKFTEYDVVCHHFDAVGGETYVRYQRARLMTGFSSAADFETFSLRSPTNSDGSQSITTGSRVLLLCVNGRTNSSYIIGAAPHPKSAGVTEDEGHFYKFQFNGILFAVNKDGELEISFKGATKDDGELTDEADPEASGTKLSITKEGNFLITTNPEGEKPQYVLVDHQNKRMELSANTGYSVTVQDGPALISAKQDVALDSDAQVTVDAANDVSIKSENGNVNITGNSTPGFGVILGSGSDAMLKGTTYRTQEALANQNVAAMLQAASVAIAAGATALAASPAAAAAPSFTAASASLASASAALQAFEAQAPNYLSLNNKND